MLGELRERLQSILPLCHSLQDAVFEVLKEAILKGSFWPGQEINQVVLAESLYVSRVPVRESLRRLEAAGLVKCNRFKKARVLMPDPLYLEQVYQTRAILEGEAARMAAEHITDEEISVLLGLLHRIDELLDNDSMREVDLLSKQFHWRLIQACDNSVLAMMVRDVWTEFPKYAFVMVPWRARESRDEHYGIVNALCLRDGDMAKRLLTANLEKGGRRLSEFVRRWRDGDISIHSASSDGDVDKDVLTLFSSEMAGPCPKR